MLEGYRVGILVEQGFEDSELVETVRAMTDSGAVVVIIGSGSGKSYRGMRGKARITVDSAADNVRVDQLDALVIPGGYAPDKMRLHQSMVDLVKKANDLGKIVAAICHGPQLLISADVVKGRRVTSWPSIAIDLTNAGATWVDEPVVQDRNIITAGRPADLPRFNKVVIDALRRKAVLCEGSARMGGVGGFNLHCVTDVDQRDAQESLLKRGQNRNEGQKSTS
jgi:protease I